MMFFICATGAFVVVRTSKWFGHIIASYLGTSTALEKKRNVRKFADQYWQFIIHLVMTVMEVWVSHDKPWWTNGRMFVDENGVVDTGPGIEPLPEVKLIYIIQLAIWFYTAVSHRYFEARHKDYYVMYAHHICTLALLISSWVLGVFQTGILILLVHDASDIMVDLLKMSNYLGLDEKSGFYCTEILFVLNLISWLLLRLYLYPVYLVKTVWEGWYYHTEVWGAQKPENGTWFIILLPIWLNVLLFMHIYWFGLFIRLAIRLLNENAHDAGREEYEGHSTESEPEERLKKQ